MKKLTIVITVIAALILPGCATLDYIMDNIDDIDIPEKPVPEEPPEKEPPEDGEIGGSSKFLWKPVSETRPGAAVLIPCDIRHEDIDGALLINGDIGEVYQYRPGYANGNRIHFFLKDVGSGYGGEVEVELPTKDGGTVEWTVPEGSERYTSVTRD